MYKSFRHNALRADMLVRPYGWFANIHGASGYGCTLTILFQQPPLTHTAKCKAFPWGGCRGSAQGIVLVHSPPVEGWQAKPDGVVYNRFHYLVLFSTTDCLTLV